MIRLTLSKNYQEFNSDEKKTLWYRGYVVGEGRGGGGISLCRPPDKRLVKFHDFEDYISSLVFIESLSNLTIVLI